MAEYSSDPFQMDEDMSVEREGGVRDNGIANGVNGLEDPPRNYTTPRYDQIRSKLDQIKLDEEYEEDIDDKFDLNEKNVAVSSDIFAESLNQPLTPPENFAPVINRIYRSSFPLPQNFQFLKRLKLKSILCLIPEDYPQPHLDFLAQENIKLFQLGMSGNKEPFVKISPSLITEAIKIVLDPQNQPIIIHCNRGKHRTGCLVGVLRRLQNWSLTIIFDEYRKFASPKERQMDQQFIELYDDTEVMDYCITNDLLPLSWD